MQNRMKTHSLDVAQIEQLLYRVQTGTLATTNADMTPYITPVHFVYFKNKIYFHGLPKGQKISNILMNGKVSFCAFEMEKLLLDENRQPCSTNTQYQSVIISGTASIIDDIDCKTAVLKEIIVKYTPHLKDVAMPANMIKGTAVIEIAIDQITGKYY